MHDPYATADKAVDGNYDRDMKKRSCISADSWDASHTGQAGEAAWWYVDLEQEYEVYEVGIITRDSNPSDERKYIKF